jgi:hypothetical protein
MKSFPEWLADSQAQRDEFTAHCASPIPTDRGVLDGDIEKSINHSDVAGDQLVEIEWYLTKATEEAWVELSTPRESGIVLRALGQDMTALQKERWVESKVADIQRLHDRVEHKCKILNARIRAEIDRRRNL